MKPDRLAKARTMLAKRKVIRAAQTVTVGPYSVHRVDALNWQIRGPGINRKNYYHRFLGALEALPDKMLHAEAKNALADVLALQNAILGVVREFGKEARIKGVLSL